MKRTGKKLIEYKTPKHDFFISSYCKTESLICVSCRFCRTTESTQVLHLTITGSAPATRKTYAHQMTTTGGRNSANQTSKHVGKQNIALTLCQWQMVEESRVNCRECLWLDWLWFNVVVINFQLCREGATSSDVC